MRTGFDRSWSRGFVVVEVTDIGYRLRRESDASLLPVVFVADENQRYVAVSRAACELLGYTREELLALRVGDVARYPEAEAEYYQQAKDAAMAR